MEKGIKNVNANACKIGSALTRATNQKLDVAGKKRRKREEIVEKQKIDAMAAKRQRAREEISLSNEEEENYESDTRDKTDPN